MAIALRKTLALTALALTASFLPTAGAQAVEAASPALRAPGLYCLANAWNTPNVSTKPCDAKDQGQHWTLSGHQISLTNAPAYCLANTWNAADVSVKPCDPKDQGQYWNVSGQQIALTYAPAYCFSNAWNTPNVSTKPCDAKDQGQRWVIFKDQISLAAA
ncbi:MULTISPECIES: ricin-type beta-trefoil lectin domain protein [Streptomyces]|uniref:RICIN domain-containing protein n=1 Tax=Streptomyces anulatus TaxID=1892 RepID=A0ABZ1ZGH7_STRAQ|nr:MULTISPECIES: ricin-type beta-trefoil lectin domain protein [Streptomyces]WST90012.1 RICIN domain-containing protein [Streptomyces anulatus]WSV78124.1 RICIN domain-containing protein [Streptomyces anulatus]WSW87554.1 RICIN domain-containing protein [Streptomyces anulatus]